MAERDIEYAARHRRLGAGAVAVAAALVVLVLMVGSGLFGGWVATRLDQDSPVPAAPGTGVEAAADLDRSSLAAAVRQVEPSVVSIKAGDGEGSGVVLDTEGHILTNHHVATAAGAGPLTVTFSDGKSQPGAVVDSDPRSDLAVLRVPDGSGLRPAELGDSDAVRTGDTVLALGSPLGLSGSVTAGIVSAKDRTIQVGDPAPGAASISGMIQTDAPINPGNSGGALVDTAGRVIGINTAIATAGGQGGSIGVGFAIPANTAAQVTGQLIAGEQVSHPYLGTSVADAEGGGALVQAVAPDSPAAGAGLRPGDVITRYADQAVTGADELVAAVQAGRTGEQVTLIVVRAGTEQQVAVTLAEAPSA